MTLQVNNNQERPIRRQRQITVKRQPYVKDGVAYLPLTQGLTALLDPQDLHLVEGWNWSARKIDRTYYAARSRLKSEGKGGPIYLHRVLLGHPGDSLIDHISGDGLDNRRLNLRTCTNAENTRNSSGRAKRKHVGLPRGVYPNGKGYQARITANGRKHNLGTYPTPEQASNARDTACLEHHGEFCRLNNPYGF